MYRLLSEAAKRGLSLHVRPRFLAAHATDAAATPSEAAIEDSALLDPSSHPAYDDRTRKEGTPMTATTRSEDRPGP